MQLNGNPPLSAPSENWGNNPTDGNFIGTFESNASGIVYSRPSLTGCAGGNCTSSWGNGGGPTAYGSANFSFFPKLSSLIYNWGEISTIEFNSKTVLATNTLASAFDCGIAIGFGTTGTGPTSANNANISMTIPGHTQTCGGGVACDQFRFIYRIENNGSNFSDSLVLDTYMNNNTNGAAATWGTFYRSTTFDVIPNNFITTNGDYINLKWKLTFDHSNHTIKFDLIPTAAGPTANINLAQAQSWTWDYTLSYSATVNGEAAGGIIFSPNTTARTNGMLTLDEFEQQTIAIGFFANGAPLSCEYNNLIITKL